MKALLFPGHGAQFTGMGQDLFHQFPKEVQQADTLFGFSTRDLCIDDPDNLLSRFEYAQPALYLVNALSFLSFSQKNQWGDYQIAAGHGVGEFNALHAAGMLDFYAGLALVKRRAELANQVTSSRAAVVANCELQALEDVLREAGCESVAISQYNAPRQFTIVGSEKSLRRVEALIRLIKGRLYLLNQQPAVHAEVMQHAERQFADYVQHFRFCEAETSVLSNVSGEFYASEPEKIKQQLVQQLSHPLKWIACMETLVINRVTDIYECGPGDTLKVWWSKFKEECVSTSHQMKSPSVKSRVKSRESAPIAVKRELNGMSLGCTAFKEDYGVKYAYYAGGLYRGVSGADVVIRMAKAGLLSFLGSAGQEYDDVDRALNKINDALGYQYPYGVSVLAQLTDPSSEMALFELLMSYDVRIIEAIGFLEVTPSLVRYRLQGLSRGPDGRIVCRNKPIVRVFRAEVAHGFFKPAPERIVNQLLNDKLITPEQAALAQRVPVAHDVCVDSNVSGASDRNSMVTLFPEIIRIRDKMRLEHGYQHQMRVGAMGGIGAPDGVVASLMLGAEFVATASINQCTIEADTSESVKTILQSAQTQDVDYAPFLDLFELGGQLQVIRKGSFFSTRASKLYELWQRHSSIAELDGSIVYQLETNYFRRRIDDVWRDVYAYYQAQEPQEIIKANRNPKHRMALIFKWYLSTTFEHARAGNEARRVDYQIHCSQAMGAFNQWVKGTKLENWSARHVDEIAIKLMDTSAQMLTQRIDRLYD